MKRHHTFTNAVRLVISAALAMAASVALTYASPAPASATSGTFAPQTAFAVDGDPAGPNDFLTPYGPGTTPGGLPTTGMYGVRRIVDNAVDPTQPDGCAYDGDDSADETTGKVSDGPIWLNGGPDPNGKTDIDFIDFAAEKVDVSGQIHDILYVGYQKCGGNGTWQTLLTIDDGDGVVKSEGDTDGDFLFVFDFNPNDNSVVFSAYRLVGGAYQNYPITNTTAIQGFALVDYGEVALNLTALGIIGGQPVPPGTSDTCSSINVSGQSAAITGGALTSSVKDIITVPPFIVSNCGDLTVEKQAEAGNADVSQPFHYIVDQLDGAPVHDATLGTTGVNDTTEPDSDIAEIDASILIDQTDTWTDVLSQADYFLNEDQLPPSWQRVRIECTYTDIFADVTGATTKTVILYSTDPDDVIASKFLIPPTEFNGLLLPPTSCVMVNDAIGVTIAKTGVGPTTDFLFDVGTAGDPTSVADDTAVTLGSSEFQVLPEFGTYRIYEEDPGTTPNWSLDSISCVNGAGDPVGTADLAGRYVDIDVASLDDDITCTFENNLSGRIEIEKVGSPDGAGPFAFDVSWSDTDVLLSIGDPAHETGDVPAGVEYSITELLDAFNASIAPAPAFAGSVECSVTGSGGTTTEVSDLTATFTLQAGDTVRCTYTNDQMGRIIVQKETTNGDGTFTFDLPGTSGDGSITTDEGAGTTSLSVDVPTGDYDIVETIPAGWNLDSVSCDNGSGTLANGENSGTMGAVSVGAGEIVTCTFTNSRETATLTLTKDWSADAAAGDSVTLTASGNDANTAGPANGGSVAPSTDTDAVLTIYPGETVTLTEVAALANVAEYGTTLSCNNGAAGALTYAAGAQTGSFAVVADDPADVTCTFVNSRTAANLTLQKVWIDGFEGDADRLLGPDTATIDAGGSQNLSTVGETSPASVTVPVLSGASIDLSETFGDNTGSYTTTLVCTDADGLTYTAGDLSGSYTMPAIAADVTCTFTNTRTSTDLTLTKNWTNAADGDSVDLGIAGEAGIGTGAIAGDESGTDATLTVYSGEVVDLSEAFNPGQPSWYNTGLSCTSGDLTYATGALAAELEITSTDAPITCTFTNTRRTANVVVKKDIAPDTDGGLFDLAVNGVDRVTDGGDGATSAPVSVLVGDPVTVAEAAGTGTSLANYTSQLSCDSSVVPANNTGTAGGFTVPADLADGATITCTFTNSRKSATLTLTKDWVNGAAGDSVSLTAGGSSGNSVTALGASTAPDTDSDAVLTIWAGETATLTEAYVPANIGSYTADLSCTAAGLTYTGGDLSGTFAVGSDPADVTCTFVNTRTSAELTLRKAWVDGAQGDATDLDITSELGQTPADGATSTADGSIGTFTDTTNVVTATVLSGEEVDLAEVLADGNLGAYDSQLACGTLPPVDGTSGTYAMPKTPAPVTCTFTNTRTRVDLVVDKAWVNAVEDDAADITVTGDLGAPTATSTSTGAAGIETDASVVTATVLSGETVTVSEALADANLALYTSSLDCGDGVIGSTSGDVTVPKDAATNISCTFTNTAERGTIIIVKNIEGANEGTFDFTGDWTTDGVNSLGAFQVETGLVDPLTGSVTYSGVLVPKDGGAYTVVETDAGSNFDGTSITCVDTDGGSGPNGGTALPLTGSIDLDNGEIVTCTFTNTEKAKIIVIKDAQPDSAAAFDFTGDLGAFTLVDDGTASGDEHFESSLLDARNAVTYDVTELATAGWTLDSASCTGADSSALNGNVLTVDVTPGVTATCTFVNTADPAGLKATKSVSGVVGPWGPFTFSLSGAADTATFTGDADQAVDSVDPIANWTELVEGETYTLTENEVPGYETGATFTCVVFTAADPNNQQSVTDADAQTPGFQFVATAGANYECEITNVAIPPTLVVNKTTVGDVGTFTFDVTATDALYPVGPLTATTTVENTPAATDTVDLQAGVGYSIDEELSDAWVEGPLTCTVTPADDSGTVDYVFDTITQPGDVISCEITNTKRAQIIVEKTTVPAGLTDEFGFEASWNGAADDIADFVLADGGQENSGYIDPSVEYVVTELAADGFALTAVQCTSGTGDVDASTATVTPTPGETVTCTFTNNMRGEVLVDKSALGQVTRDGTTYSVSYELTVSNESYIDEPFTLSDAPDMADNVAIQTMVVNGPGVTDLDIAPAGGLITSGTIAARAGQADGPAALVYTVVVTFTMDAVTTTELANRQECFEVTGGYASGSGAYNNATVAFTEYLGETSNSDDACVDLPTPSLDVQKTGVGTAQQVEGQTYLATYTVTVTNTGDGPGSYSLTDDALAAQLGAGNVSNVSVSIVGDPVFPVEIAGGTVGEPTVHTYTVEVTFDVNGEMTHDERTCAVEDTPLKGAFNSITMLIGDGSSDSDTGCVDIPDPAISVTKVRTADTAALVSGNTYSASFTITVTNTGDGPGAYTLADTPVIPGGYTSLDIQPAPVADTQIAAGDSDVYTVTVEFEVAGSLSVDQRTCVETRDESGTGAYNGVVVTYNDGGSSSDSDCVDIPVPNVDYSKVVVGDGAVYNGDNNWTVTYDVVVTNLDPVEGVAGPSQYSLTDTLDFGPGATVNGVTVTTDPDPIAGLNGSFDGEGDTTLATDVGIAAGATHTYTISVDVTVVPTEGTNGDCDSEGGFRNTAGISVASDPELAERADRSACAPFSVLTLVKELSSLDGGNATIDQFTLTATLDGDVILSGHTLVTESVPAGDYVLAETQQPGYASDGYTCVGGEMIGQTVTVLDGASVVCTIVNHDLPVDLELTKTDNGFETLAGGDPVPYTITVKNIGQRDADLGEPVTVVDTLPAFMSWNTYPANCTEAGQVLTCDIDPALMTAGGAGVVINTTVDVAPDAPSGDYVNHAYVTTDDDPVCEPAGECVPPPCEEAAGNNNVDCESTPVERFATITIVKADNVAAGDAVQPGDTYTYTLAVTNNGPSVILPGLTVDDDLPAQLQFVSVSGGAGWSCNNADPIECTYGPSLAPGETAPAITVTVRVTPTATGTSIVNVALATGFVETDCADIPQGLGEAISTCDPITDTDTEETPLEVIADLAIVKTASVAQLSAGGSFNWTLTVTNNGPAPAVNAKVTDLVPAPMQVTSVSSTFFSCTRSGNDVTCTVPSMAVGATGTVTIAVSVPAAVAGGTLANVGAVGADTPDPNLDNNSDDASVILVAQIPPETVAPTIPPTGSNSTAPMIRIALVFLFLGALGLAATRRRRDEEAVHTA